MTDMELDQRQLVTLVLGALLLGVVLGMPLGIIWWRRLTDGARLADRTEHDLRCATEWVQRQEGQGND